MHPALPSPIPQINYLPSYKGAYGTALLVGVEQGIGTDQHPEQWSPGHESKTCSTCFSELEHSGALQQFIACTEESSRTEKIVIHHSTLDSGRMLKNIDANIITTWQSPEPLVTKISERGEIQQIKILAEIMQQKPHK